MSVNLYNLVLLAQLSILFTYIIGRTIRYHRSLEDFYSCLENKSINSNYAIIIWISIALLFSFTFTICKRNFWQAHPEYTIAFFTLWAIPYCGWCYTTLKLKYTVVDFLYDLQESEQEEKGDGLCPTGIAE